MPWVTVVLAASTAIAAIFLLSVKVAHRIILNSHGMRTAQYVAAIAEMIGRRYIPTAIPEVMAHRPRVPRRPDRLSAAGRG